jgi:Spy/CpxP family protein refolding chaperone
MKKFLITLSAVIAVSATPVLAQNDQPKPEAGREGRAAGRMNPEERLKMMTSSLGLTQEQQDKIKAVMDGNKDAYAKIRELPQDERRAKMQEVMKTEREKITAILTPEQQEKYKAAMASRGNRGDRGGATDAPKKDEPKKEADKKP